MSLALIALVLQAASPLEPALYRVSLAQDRSSLSVEARLPGHGERLLLDPFQADHLERGWATFVRGIRVSANGRDLELIPEAGAAWRVVGGTGAEWVLRYEVDLGFTRAAWPPGNEQAGRTFADALYLVGRAVFVTPEELGRTEVSFEMPLEWHASTPWSSIGTSTFVVPSRIELVRNSFVLGRHGRVTLTQGPFELELALPGPASSGQALVEPVLRSVLAAYLRLFPDTPPTRYLMTFFRDEGEDGEAFASSAAFTTRAEIAPHTRVVWGNFLAHELFHFWNGQRIRGAGERSTWRWVAEGFTEYQANVTLVREGILSQELFLKKVERHLGNYADFTSGRAHEPLSLAAAGADTSRYRFGVYDGGWTAALVLDVLIREGSGGARSLDDLLRELWRRHREGSPGYELADLEELAEELAGRGLDGFIRRHVLGEEPLPYRETLAKLGFQGAFKAYAAEAFLTLDPAAPSPTLERRRAWLGVE